MSFDDYMGEVLARKQMGLGQDQRPGQFYFNVLHDVRRDLATRVRQTPSVDPFFSDVALPAFLTWVAGHWDE